VSYNNIIIVTEMVLFLGFSGHFNSHQGPRSFYLWWMYIQFSHFGFDSWTSLTYIIVELLTHAFSCISCMVTYTLTQLFIATDPHEAQIIEECLHSRGARSLSGLLWFSILTWNVIANNHSTNTRIVSKSSSISRIWLEQMASIGYGCQQMYWLQLGSGFSPPWKQ
jgi:hypothetical protein